MSRQQELFSVTLLLTQDHAARRHERYHQESKPGTELFTIAAPAAARKSPGFCQVCANDVKLAVFASRRDVFRRGIPG